MSKKRSNEDWTDIGDAGVSDWYRSVEPESPPPHLDRAIVKRASEEVGKDASFRWFIPWMRPAAFVATLGLSLAVLLDLMNPSTDGASPPIGISENSASVRDDFASAAAESSTRIRRIGETSSEQSLTGDPSANRYRSSIDDAVERRICDDQQSATPEAWLACIEALRDAGRTAEADAELERFDEAHPNYRIPRN